MIWETAQKGITTLKYTGLDIGYRYQRGIGDSAMGGVARASYQRKEKKNSEQELHTNGR